MTAPYTDGEEHLRDALDRVATLLRAHAVAWRHLAEATRPEHLWGQVHVDAVEIDRLADPPDPEPAPPPAATRLREQARDAEARIADRLPADRTGLRLARFVERFGLDELARDVVLLGVLLELDERYRRLVGYLRDDHGQQAPTVGLALAALDPDGSRGSRTVFSPDGPLRRDHLVALGPAPGGTGLASQVIHVDDRITAHLMGADAWDARLTTARRELPAADLADLVIDAGTRAQLAGAARWQREGDPAVLVLTGPRGSGRRTAAAAVAAAAGVRLVGADLAAASRAPAGLRHTLELVVREAVLADAALCWIGTDHLAEPGHEAEQELLLEAAAGFNGLTVLCGPPGWDPAGQPAGLLHVALRPPSFDDRVELWTRALSGVGDPDGRADLAHRLANAFQLTGGQIGDAAATAVAQARLLGRAPQDVTERDVDDACRRHSTRRLVAFARRVDPPEGEGWAPLVLPAESRRSLEALSTRIARRGPVLDTLGLGNHLFLGRGIVAMFTGPPGEGKTMAAAVLARRHRVDLYRVDLSAVVSKYVGETEKNLARVFADASEANAMLFFDEADALFGKRGEVKEARDRWSNVQQSHLLQEIEEFSGVVLLASNLRQNIDDAFLRRIHVLVDFPSPDVVRRRDIWRATLPARLQGPDDDELADLARLRLSGGEIRNVVVDAAFEGLDDGEITLGRLVGATAREYRKQGRPILRGEFGELYPYAAEALALEDGPA